MQPGVVVVVTGPPGSGKSTVAELLAPRWDRAVVVRGDEFFDFIRTGYIAPYLPSSMDQNSVVVDAMSAAVAQYARGGYQTILDVVLGPWFLGRLLSHFEGDLEVHYVILRPREEVAVARAMNRAADALRDEVPIRNMHAAFADVGAFEGHVVDNSDLAPDATADGVKAALRAGQFLIRPRTPA